MFTEELARNLAIYLANSTGHEIGKKYNLIFKGEYENGYVYLLESIKKNNRPVPEGLPDAIYSGMGMVYFMGYKYFDFLESLKSNKA